MQERQERSAIGETGGRVGDTRSAGDRQWAALQDPGHVCGPQCEAELRIARIHWTESPFAAAGSEQA